MSPAPSPEEKRANAVYEALLWALSRPGEVRVLPEEGEDQIVDALIDRECRVHAAGSDLAAAVRRTGAEDAPLRAADHAFLGALRDVAPLAEVAQGSDLHPDDGATVFVSATLGEGAPLRLTGPGVEDSRTVSVGGLPDGFWAARARAMRYPVGFELFFLDGYKVMGVPRSTTVEAL